MVLILVGEWKGIYYLVFELGSEGKRVESFVGGFVRVFR